MVLLLCLLFSLRATAQESVGRLLEDYKRYSLPFPPAEGRLVRLKEGGGSINGVPQYSHSLSFLTTDNKGVQRIWVGCRSIKLGNQVQATETKPVKDALAGTTPPRRDAWSGGFPTSPDLALAVQCEARGYHELAAALWDRFKSTQDYDPFDRGPRWPQDSRAAIALIAWNHWCNEFALAKGDRRAILKQLLELSHGPFGLDTKAHRNILSDMEKTLQPTSAKPESYEATIDSLVDVVAKSDRYGGGFPTLDGDVRRSAPFQKLRNSGLDAVPELIKHTHDFRMTHCIGHDRRGTWHVRIADVVRELLNGLVGEELSFDFFIREGRGYAVDQNQVLHWWGQAQGSQALDYLLKNALTKKPDGSLEPNEQILNVLGSRYPDELVKIFEKSIENVGQSYALFEALGASKASSDEKARLLLSAITSKDSWKRDFSLRELLQLKHQQAIPLLIRELDQIPKTPNEAYWTSSAGRFAQLVGMTNDERAWTALLANAKRVDIGQRLEMINAIAGRCGRRDKQVIEFLTAFLDDKERRVINDRIPELAKVKDPQKAIDAMREDLFSGPCAGFNFDSIEVRDFAALQLADFLGLKVQADNTWKEKDWEKLRRDTNQALSKQAKTSAKGNVK